METKCRVRFPCQACTKHVPSLQAVHGQPPTMAPAVLAPLAHVTRIPRPSPCCPAVPAASTVAAAPHQLQQLRSLLAAHQPSDRKRRAPLSLRQPCTCCSAVPRASCQAPSHCSGVPPALCQKRSAPLSLRQPCTCCSACRQASIFDSGVPPALCQEAQRPVEPPAPGALVVARALVHPEHEATRAAQPALLQQLGGLVVLLQGQAGRLQAFQGCQCNVQGSAVQCCAHGMQ